MDPLVEHVDVWAATIEDRPGDLAHMLAELREAGADLQFIIARRAESGKGVVFVTPLRGDREIAAAAQVGFNVAHTLHSVEVIGRDRPGIAAELTRVDQKLADWGINLRGHQTTHYTTFPKVGIIMDTAGSLYRRVRLLGDLLPTYSLEEGSRRCAVFKTCGPSRRD